MALVAHLQPHVLQHVDMRVIAFDIGEQRHIVARARAREMRFQPGAEVAIGARPAQCGGIFVVGVNIGPRRGHHRLLRGQGAGLFECSYQLAGLDLGVLDVGLVEGIDTEHGPCDRGRDLKAEKFLTDVVDRFHDDTDHGMPGLLQRGQFFIVRSIVFAFGPDVDEEPVPSIQRHLANRFAVDRDQALAFLAGGFRDQLFGPGTEIGYLLR